MQTQHERFGHLVRRHFATLGTDECWRWRGGLTYEGYGRMSRTPAHRVALEWANGCPLPPYRATGLMVCHTCDVRECVNPAHLYLGTASMNQSDRFADYVPAWAPAATSTSTHAR